MFFTSLTAADNLFADGPEADESSAMEQTSLLREFLQADSRKETDVMAEAKQAVIFKSTLKRAKALTCSCSSEEILLKAGKTL